MLADFEKNGTTLTALPEGRLDSVTSPEFKDLLEKEMVGVNDVVIDLEKVDYVSSGGLRVLLWADQEMKDRHGTMKVIHVSEPIKKIFGIVGFMDMITVE